MNNNLKESVPTLIETYVQQTLTYAHETEGKFYLIENVPVKVCVETGERLFSPQTVERLQQLIWEETQPVRIVEIPVLDFAA